jgi:hypothetical protein
MNPNPQHRARRPEFLGIGAARSGTTWLGQVLGNHPDVWIPRRKELHYWTRGARYLSPGYMSPDEPLRRLFGRGGEAPRFRRELVRAAGRGLIHRDWQQLRWDCRYFLGHCSDDWYETLFADRDERLTGEITPAYALLDDADVAHLAARYPDLRILYVMRDPVERAWSTICYHHSRRQISLDRMSEAEVIAYLAQPGLRQRSSYLEVVRRWTHHFGAERLFLAFYDEIGEAPQAILARLESFLGIAPFRPAQEVLGRRVNQSGGRRLPESVRRALVGQYRDEVSGLADMYGGYPARWLASYE